jgi:hypothetical protein
MAKTADQVVVEIQAMTDQYTKAIKKVADDTKRSMAAVEGAVTKAEAKITKASGNVAAATEKSSRRRMKAAADAATSEQAAAERSARAITKTADITERSAARIEAASRRRQDALDAGPVGVPVHASAAQEAAASGREMAGGEEKESTGTKFLTEAAGRLPDLVGKLAEGQNALHVFMQEGSQLLGVFGPWGAVLGGAIGAIDSIASSLGWFATAAETAEDAKKDFDLAMASTKGVFSESEQSANELTQSLSLLQAGLLNIAKGNLEEALDKNNEALAKAQKEIAGAALAVNAGDIGVRGKTGGTEADASVLKIVSELNSEAPLTASRVNELVGQLGKLKGEVLSGGEDIQYLVDQLRLTGNLMFEVEQKVTLLNRTTEKMEEYTRRAGGGLVSFGSDAEDATGKVAALSFQVDRFREAASRAAASPLTKGLVPLDLSGGSPKGDSGGPPKDDDSPFANLPSSLLGVPFLDDQPPSGGGGSGGGGGGKREGKPGAATLETQQSEIKLNQALLDGWRKGEAALEQIRVAYEAVNAAREAGLTSGTKEYESFVAQYQANKSNNAALLTKIDLMKRGDELTKSVMTSQEKLDAQLAEYDKLRNQRIISTQTYNKLVEAAKGTNAGYVEGIKAIGDAIQNGIQGATSFSDALLKVGTSLAQLLLKAALFGDGPLGKIFGDLTGLTGGLLGGLGGGYNYDGGTGLGPIGPGGIAGHAAGGGQVLPGRLYEVGEVGREWFAPSVPGQVIPNHVIKNAAGGGGGGSGQPIVFNISMAGANGDRAIAEIASAAVKKGLQSVPEINRQHAIRFA